MIINCTLALINKIGINVIKSDTIINSKSDTIYSWTATKVDLGKGKNCDFIILLTNNKTKFNVLIGPILKGQKLSEEDLKKSIKDGISNFYKSNGINGDVINEYLKNSEAIVFYNNTDPKNIKFSNSSVTLLKNQLNLLGDIEEDYLKPYEVDIINKNINIGMSKLVSSSIPKYLHFEELRKTFKDLNLFKYRAFEFEITLDTDFYKVIRRIIVPDYFDLMRMHLQIQRAFNWSNSHLFSFEIGNRSFNSFSDEFMLDEDVELEEVKLSDYFPKRKSMTYIYDFGDNWEHKIKLVRTIDDFNEESPILTKKIGVTPPENVSGLGGFENFINILRDPSNSDHDDFYEWGIDWIDNLDIEDPLYKYIFKGITKTEFLKLLNGDY